jgi:putative iron-dependent peroxidase
MGNHSQSTGTQPAILQETGSHGLFVVFDVKSGRPGVAKAAARAAADLPALVNSLGASLGNAGLAATIAFGSEFWDQLETGKKPKHLRKQKPVQGAPGIVPSTGGDLFLHIKSDRHDVNWDLAHKFKDTLPPETVVMDETEGFTYKDNRDLTGFIDGTANPKGHDPRAEAALIDPSDDAAFAGGSYVLVQKYIHNLKSWNTLSDRDQEQAVGRRKSDSEELPVKPPTSHIARAELVEGGKERPIVRHSMPWGKATGDSGLLFCAYAKDPGIFEKQLERLYGVSGDGVADRMMSFTKAVSSAIFFAPSLETLSTLR